jgi:hypothetical protein
VSDLKPGPAQLNVRILHVFGSYSNVQYAWCPVITVHNSDLSQVDPSAAAALEATIASGPGDGEL